MNLWGRKEVAQYFGVTVAYVDMIRHKLPQPTYIGRLPRWFPDEIQEAAKSWRGTNGANPPKAA